MNWIVKNHFVMYKLSISMIEQQVGAFHIAAGRFLAFRLNPKMKVWTDLTYGRIYWARPRDILNIIPRVRWQFEINRGAISLQSRWVSCTVGKIPPRCLCAMCTCTLHMHVCTPHTQQQILSVHMHMVFIFKYYFCPKSLHTGYCEPHIPYIHTNTHTHTHLYVLCRSADNFMRTWITTCERTP